MANNRKNNENIVQGTVFFAKGKTLNQEKQIALLAIPAEEWDCDVRIEFLGSRDWKCSGVVTNSILFC